MAPRDIESVSPHFLDKTGSFPYDDYDDYRQQAANNVVPLARAAAGVPSLGLPQDVARPGAIPMVYVIRAHQPEATAVKEESGLLAFIKEHPWLTASVVIPGALQLKRWAKR